MVNARLAADQLDRDQHGDQGQAHLDQVAPDRDHRLLEMRGVLRLPHQPRGLAEIGLHAGRDHEPEHRALLGDRAGIGDVADLLVGRQGFPGERRLIDAQVVALEQLDVGRDDGAEAQPHHVAGHQLACVDLAPVAVAPHPGFQREGFLQLLDGVAGLVLLPEPDQRVEQQENEDDDKVGPVADHGGQHRGDLGHPRNRAPEIAQDFQQDAAPRGLDRVWPVAAPARSGIGRRKPLRPAVQFLEETRRVLAFEPEPVGRRPAGAVPRSGRRRGAGLCRQCRFCGIRHGRHPHVAAQTRPRQG